MKETSKKLFTPDEIRVILKWADAYQSSADKDDSIGRDTLYDSELSSLKLHLHDASAEILLGMLNTCYLMGFDTFDHPYSLQKIWETLSLDTQVWASDEHVESYHKFRIFLEKAGFIKPMP